MRRSPLKRTPFKRKEPSYSREPHPLMLEAGDLALIAPTSPRIQSSRKGVYSGTTRPATPKERPVRSEAYRRAVAALCCVHCGRLPTQCAHANTGKGMGIKASDLESFPLCVPCHAAFDQGALFTKEERRAIEPQWAAATRAAVKAAGLWPKGLEESNA